MQFRQGHDLWERKPHVTSASQNWKSLNTYLDSLWAKLHADTVAQALWRNRNTHVTSPPSKNKNSPRKQMMPSSVQNPPSPPWHLNSQLAPNLPCSQAEPSPAPGVCPPVTPASNIKLSASVPALRSPPNTLPVRRQSSSSHVHVTRLAVLHLTMLNRQPPKKFSHGNLPAGIQPDLLEVA